MKTNLIKITTAFLIVTMGIFISSCGNKDMKETPQEKRLSAKVAVATLKEYPVVYSFSGKLEAEKQSNLSTRMMGQVERIYVNPGQQVKQGDLLLQIRNQDVLAKKAQVEASKVEAASAFKSAEKDLQRFEALYKTKSASDKEMDDIRTRYQMAKARLDVVDQMQNEVDESIRYAAIHAPYNGIITSKFIQEGDMANPGMPLLSIESSAQWKVIVRIPEADIALLKLNDPVKVQFNALNNLQLDGVIAEINPSATNTGNQFEAKILLTNNSGNTANLYSGMYATVFYQNGTQPAVLISQNSLVEKGQLVGLYALSQSETALLRWVKTGKTYGDSIEILSGLSGGEKYIQSCEGKLYDGALIQIK